MSIEIGFDNMLLDLITNNGRITGTLLYYVFKHGKITSLDKFAHDLELDPGWVRRCAHDAAAKGLIKLVRLDNQNGRPYQATPPEAAHEK
jgi:hypothetical protein